MKGRAVEWLAAAALLGCFVVTVSEVRADEAKRGEEYMIEAGKNWQAGGSPLAEDPCSTASIPRR